jgi:serine phosphatase RsbU (regulator of sigma subunit)
MRGKVEVQVAAAKIGKYATSESGDTLEMIERPRGGLSLVLADGQRSGRAAKAISNLVARKAIALLAEGVRDGAAARAANDYLYAQRGGKVSATLNIVSVDLVSKTLVLSRNSHCPVIVHGPDGEQRAFDEPSDPVGVYRMTKPRIAELPVRVGMIVVVFTDGLLHAGSRSGEEMDVAGVVERLYNEHRDSRELAVPIADGLLDEALALDNGRPSDDVSVVVLAVTAHEGDEARRLQARLPISPLQQP